MRLTWVSDVKLNPSAGVYLPSIVSSQDYYSFGSTMPGRSFGTPGKYEFNGKELDNDINGDDYNFGARIYDSRLGRFLSVDPKWSQYPEWSPYVFALNNPIRLIDRDGEGPDEPMHYFFLTTVAIDIYNAAKAQGYSGKGALLVMAQASIESGYGKDAIKRGDYNLFGVMTLGNDYKETTSAGRIKDYTNNGKWNGSIKDYFNSKTRKWPQSDKLMKNESFTADDIDAAFYTGQRFEKKAVRNKTGHNSYNTNDISKDEETNNNKYGTKLLGQMHDYAVRFTASIEYAINSNNTKISEINKQIDNVFSGGGFFTKLAKFGELVKQKTKVEEQNKRLTAIKDDINK